MTPSLSISASFERIGVPLKPNHLALQRMGVLNPACARLRNGGLQVYPRLVADGNISRIGSYRAYERGDGKLDLEACGFALQPEAPYELRDEPKNYGCEDPRVTFIHALDLFVMAYVAVSERPPEVAVAVSKDGLDWRRLGPVRFRETDLPFADKDAAFFPEPVRSPSGVESIAFYHRPTLQSSIQDGERGATTLRNLPPEEREGIAIAYIPLDAVRRDIGELCNVAETHRLELPEAGWGRVKVGAGTPPMRIREGWLAVVHGVDDLEHPDRGWRFRYSAGIIIHDADHIDRVLYRSPEPLFVPELPAELNGTVGHVVFPTGIDRRDERVFDIFYGMADYQIGRGRLTLA